MNATPFELHVFWPSDTEHRIKLTFSESVSLSLKMRLMTLTNMLQENFKHFRVIMFKKGISFEEEYTCIYNKHIINTVT